LEGKVNNEGQTEEGSEDAEDSENLLNNQKDAYESVEPKTLEEAEEKVVQ
jgi:hypothetical protein